MPLLNIPSIGMTFGRDLMPQLDSVTGFLSFLDKKNISYQLKSIPAATLKSSQAEFDFSKVLNIIFTDKDNDPLIVSNDDYVLDGHHRWLAVHNDPDKSHVQAYVIDLPILELYRVAKEYTSSLNEELDHKHFGPMLDSFVEFASKHLGIESLPQISLHKAGEEDQSSFGGYRPGSRTISVHTKNRHPMDIFRTVAHELVHHRQNEQGQLEDVETSGKTGSPIENEANAKAGQIMRHYAKHKPDSFGLEHVSESIKRGTNLRFSKFMNNLGESMKHNNTPSQREWGKPSLTKIYGDDTPGEGKKKKSHWKKKKKLEEDGILGSASGKSGLPTADGIGPEFGIGGSPSTVGGMGGLLNGFPFNTYGVSEETKGFTKELKAWATDPKTIRLYEKKYGKNAPKMMQEALSRFVNEPPTKPKKNIRKIRENWEAIGKRDMGTVPSTSQDEMSEDGIPPSKKWKKKQKYRK